MHTAASTWLWPRTLCIAFGFTLLGCAQEHQEPATGLDGGVPRNAERNAAGKPASGAAGAAGSARFPPCPLAAAGEPPVNIGAQVGSLGLATTRQAVEEAGVIARVEDDLLEITAGADTIPFRWHGPPLTAAFSVGDRVRFWGKFGLAYYGQGGRSMVRSSRASAVVIDASPWMVLSTSPGSHETLGGFSGMPVLDYALDSCCSSGDHRFMCGYSSLVARDGVDSTAIERGASGVVGPWTVTNLGSDYYVAGEYVWIVRVTLLGPGKTDEADADAGI